ncbi:MAG: hypothetical protein HRT47_14195 [Candidatus Caenarcaniphilales bacterium]|nr:hypothetical protein [Candidatus Caenarcaniphilales bacterium]
MYLTKTDTPWYLGRKTTPESGKIRRAREKAKTYKRQKNSGKSYANTQKSSLLSANQVTTKQQMQASLISLIKDGKDKTTIKGVGMGEGGTKMGLVEIIKALDQLK